MKSILILSILFLTVQGNACEKNEALVSSVIDKIIYHESGDCKAYLKEFDHFVGHAWCPLSEHEVKQAGVHFNSVACEQIEVGTIIDGVLAKNQKGTIVLD